MSIFKNVLEVIVHFSTKNLVKISFRELCALSSSSFVQACFSVPRNTAFIEERKTEHTRYCIAGAPGISSSLHRATYFMESCLSSCNHLHCNEIERLRSMICKFTNKRNSCKFPYLSQFQFFKEYFFMNYRKNAILFLYVTVHEKAKIKNCLFL